MLNDLVLIAPGTHERWIKVESCPASTAESSLALSTPRQRFPFLAISDTVSVENENGTITGMRAPRQPHSNHRRMLP